MTDHCLSQPIDAARRERADYRIGLLFVTASAVAWSTGGLFTRLVTLDSATMLAWRGIFAALGLGLVILAMQGRRGLLRFGSLDRHTFAYATTWAIAMVFFVTSLRYTTVAHVAVIFATSPFLAAALAYVFIGERPDSRSVIASLAALAGVALMVGLDTDGSPFGDLLALMMTLLSAVTIVIARRHPHIPAMHGAGLAAFLCALMTLPFSHALSVTGYEFIVLAMFGLINSAAGLALFSLGARTLPSIETALIGALDAPLAPLMVFIVFGEMPSLTTAIGGLIVFLAVAIHIGLTVSDNERQTGVAMGKGSGVIDP